MNPAAAIAIQMNNEGVELLKKSQYGPAISSFAIALANFKEMLVTDDDETQSSTQDESTIRESWPGQSSYFTCTSSSDCTLSPHTTKSISSSEEMIVLDPNHRSIIFCRPIILSKKYDKNSMGAFNKYSFAIIFNIALAHHLGGMNCIKSRAAKLRKALRLYEFAYSIHMQDNAQLQITYTLGMVNNLGHIRETLGEQQKAQQCFQQLLSTLMYVMQESGEKSCKGEWDIFLHNITHLVLRNTAMATAA